MGNADRLNPNQFSKQPALTSFLGRALEGEKMKRNIIGETYDETAGRILRENQIPATKNDDKAIGALMRLTRERNSISLRKVAGRMGISAPYLSDLKLGRRGWSARLIASALQQIERDPRC